MYKEEKQIAQKIRENVAFDKKKCLRNIWMAPKEQLAQLYRELEETGEAIKPLLETDLTTSCTSSSSYSAGEESEDTYINNQKQRQV